MSIDPRIKIADNHGWHPCIDPLVLGRAMDRVCNGRAPSLRQRVVKTLGNLRRRLAR